MAGKKGNKRSSSRKKNNIRSRQSSGMHDSDMVLIQHPPASPRNRGRSDSTDWEDTDTETAFDLSSHEEILHGFTQANERFIVPETQTLPQRHKFKLLQLGH